MKKNLGLCIRNEAGVVESQNKLPIEVCGDKTGQTCGSTCIQKLEQKYSADEIAKERIFNLGLCQFENGLAEVTIVRDDVGWKSFLQSCEVDRNRLSELLSQGQISQREFEVANLVLSGKSNIEIAKELFVSKPTVKTHLNNIYKKIGKLRGGMVGKSQ